ncbi:MAG: hypothetical protein ACYS6W_03275 [Planctomycetota bacterium]
MNLCHLDFDIVSDLELRISDFASFGIFTRVKNPLQIAPFMQNKPNFRKTKMNVSCVYTVNYENIINWILCENKPNQTQSEILNQKSQIHSHHAGNKLHTPRRQSWGCFDLSGRTTPKTAGLGLILAVLNYNSQTADKNMRAKWHIFELKGLFA